MSGEPNQRDVTFVTRGISRNMQLGLPASMGGLGVDPRDAPNQYGGGNLNGSGNTAHLMGQAGTGADRIASPKRWASNYCGIV
jgi:hypothetical protein